MLNPKLSFHRTFFSPKNFSGDAFFAPLERPSDQFKFSALDTELFVFVATTLANRVIDSADT